MANVEDFPVEKWDAIIAINLSSAFHATRLAIPAMRAKNWGRIINIASAHGLVASAQKSAYVAAKHGIVGFTKVDRAGDGHHRRHRQRHLPRLGADAAGAEAGRCARRAKDGIDDDEAKRDLLAEKQPSLQFTTPEQLGELAVFLCSPAADNVKGVAWAVDGGWTAQ